MAILKSTLSSDNTVITNGDMNRDLQDKFHKDHITLAAQLVVDIEAIYHDCFRGGLNQIDHNIIHRCKQSLGETLNSLNLFNVYLMADINMAIAQATQKQDVEAKKLRDLALGEAERENLPPPPMPNASNRFISLDSHPRVKLAFNPRGKNSVNESPESLQASNDQVSKIVDEINQLIKSFELSSGDLVRRKYTNSEDGYLISLSFSDLTNVEQVLNRLAAFIKTAESLSLDELMISQQFSTWFTVKPANPYDLELTAASSLIQTVAVSVFNLEEFTASFYVSAILNNLKIQISNLHNGSEKLSLLKSTKSINNSYLCINLQF